MSRFEWMVALRYLRAKRKQTAISVISVISVLGVAAGVAALIIVLAVNNGFKYTLESSLLSATAHVNVLERNPQFGIENWARLLPRRPPRAKPRPRPKRNRFRGVTPQNP